MVWPNSQLCTYRRPVSIAASTAARLSGSCSTDISAWMPAWIFSQTRGTPKKSVGWAAPSVASRPVAASWQKYACPPKCTGR